jgi:hypothetical protein
MSRSVPDPDKLRRIEEALEVMRQDGLIEWDCDLVAGTFPPEIWYEVRPTR